MRTLYILFITLLSCTCYAQDGYRTDTKTVLGGIVDLDDTQKGYISVEIQLKAEFYNDKLTCVTLHTDTKMVQYGRTLNHYSKAKIGLLPIRRSIL